MLKNGVYEAKLLEAGLAAGKDDSEAKPFMKFEVFTDEGTEQITWYGGTGSEKSATYSAKQLMAAGFQGNDFSDLNLPLETAFLPKKFTIAIENEEYNGKTRAKVKFVNDTSVKKFLGQAPKMAGVFAAVRAEKGIKKPILNHAPKAASNDDWKL